MNCVIGIKFQLLIKFEVNVKLFANKNVVGNVKRI